MHHDQEHVLLGAEPQQDGSQHRIVRQVERAPRLLVDEATRAVPLVPESGPYRGRSPRAASAGSGR